MDIRENQNHQTIGTLLLESGKLQPEDADKILNEQVKSGMRFGDAAIKLGLLKKTDIDEALSKQFNFSYTNLLETGADPLVVSAYKPFSSSAEQIRTLRGQLGVRWFNEHKSIVVVSPKPKTGTSIISANLAVAFAQLGKKTLLIDANMRQPSIHQLFNIENKRGLSDILVSRADQNVIRAYQSLNNLSILTSGPTPPNPVELLGTDDLEKLISHIETTYDVIIFDSPAATEHCDAQMLLSKIKGGLLVTKRNKTTMQSIEQIQKEFTINNALIVGSVINEF